MSIIEFLHTEKGIKIISIIVGFGFATMFRSACKNNTCVIVKGPKTAELNKYYRIDKKCYKYNPYSINCPS